MNRSRPDTWIVFRHAALAHMNGLAIGAQSLAAGVPATRHRMVRLAAGIDPDGGSPPRAWHVPRYREGIARMLASLAERAKALRSEHNSAPAHWVAIGPSERISQHEGRWRLAKRDSPSTRGPKRTQDKRRAAPRRASLAPVAMPVIVC
jgi:hypothetical protein